MLRRILFILFIASIYHVNAQVGIGTNDPKATLDVVATNKTGTSTSVEGILVPRVSRERAQSMLNVEKSTLVFIDDVTSGNPDEKMRTEGFYFHDGTVWSGVAAKEISAAQSAASKFFYMPSVVLPTNQNDARILDITNLNFTFVNGEYVVNLYNLFSTQFRTPVTSSIVNTENPSLPGIPTLVDTLEEVVLPTTAYHYFVTYADPNVFEEIKLDANGILRYKVKSNSIIRTGTFMNIVIKSK